MTPEEWFQKVAHHLEELEKLSKEDVTLVGDDEINNKVFWLQQDILAIRRLIKV